MSRDKNVQMSHGSIGVPKSRQSRIDTSKITEVSNNTAEIFAKLDESPVVEEPVKDINGAPRLANFKDLVFLGRMEKEISIGDWSFTIHTLDGKEQRELLSMIMSLDASKRLIYAKPYTICMALDKINGIPSEVAASSAGYEDQLEFVCSWQDSVIELLYSNYETLLASSKSIINPETLGDDLKK